MDSKNPDERKKKKMGKEREKKKKKGKKFALDSKNPDIVHVEK